MLVGKSAKDVDRRTQKIGTRADRSEPFQVDVNNLRVAIELGETSVDSKPERPVATWYSNRIGLVGQVLWEHPIG